MPLVIGIAKIEITEKNNYVLLIVIFLYFHTVSTCKDIFDKNM